MVLADNVYQDRVSGKHIIAGTFTTYRLSNKKQVETIEENGETGTVLTRPVSSPGTPSLYIALTGVRGETPLELRFVSLADAAVRMKARFSVTSSDPVQVAEFVLPIPQLQIDSAAGAYSLDLLWNGELLGAWRVNVVIIEDDKGVTNDN